MSRHEPTLGINFLYQGDSFPHKELIKVVQALPSPQEFLAYFNNIQKGQYLDLTRAISKFDLLVTKRNLGRVSTSNPYTRAFTAMAHQTSRNLDAILEKLNLDDFLDKKYFNEDGLGREDISAKLSDQAQDSLVWFCSQPSVFQSLGNGLIYFTFQKAPSPRGKITVSIDLGCGGKAIEEYRGCGPVMKKIMKRKMQTWSSFVYIGNREYTERAADSRLFEYAAAIAQKVSRNGGDDRYALVLTEEVVQDDQECSLFSPSEFQSSLDKLMRKYC